MRCGIVNPAAWMPLGLVRSGSEVVLRRIQAGHGIASRLTAMGLFVGARFQVCRNDRRGPVILGINGCRVIIGRMMAAKLMVEDAVAENP